MKKVILSIVTLMVFGLSAQAQKSSSNQNANIDLSGRAADHLMIQFGTDRWTNAPDSVKLGGGLSRHFNIYFMYDKPFKSNKHFSLAFGGGVGTSNIFFDDHTVVDIRSSAATLPFRHLDSAANHFSKTKVAEITLQAPVEIRYYSDPAHPNKSWKAAVGLKAGLLVKAYTKSKNYVDRYGNSIYGPTYVEKQIDKRFFNATELTLSSRVGYGMFSFHVDYLTTGVLREGFGPVMNKISMGLTISGL
jgi:hypothetical protein